MSSQSNAIRIEGKPRSETAPIAIVSGGDGRSYQQVKSDDGVGSWPGVTVIDHYQEASRISRTFEREATFLSSSARRCQSEVFNKSFGRVIKERGHIGQRGESKRKVAAASSSLSSEKTGEKEEVYHSAILEEASQEFSAEVLPQLFQLLSHRQLRYQLGFWGNRFPSCAQLADFLQREDEVEAVTVLLQPVVGWQVYRLFHWLTEMRYKDHLECLDKLDEVIVATRRKLKALAKEFWESEEPEQADKCLEKFVAETIPLMLDEDTRAYLRRAGFGMYSKLFNRQDSEDRNAKTIKILSKAVGLICVAVGRVFDDVFESRDISRLPAKAGNCPGLLAFDAGSVGAALGELASAFEKKVEQHYNTPHLRAVVARHNPRMAEDPKALKACQHFIAVLSSRSKHVIEHFASKTVTAILRQNGRCQREYNRDFISVLFSHIAETFVDQFKIYKKAVKAAESVKEGSVEYYPTLLKELKAHRHLHHRVPARAKLNPEWDKAFIKHDALPKIRRIIAQHGYIQEALTAVFPELMADLSKQKAFTTLFKGVDQAIEEKIVDDIADKMHKLLDPPHNNRNIIAWIDSWWKNRKPEATASMSDSALFPPGLGADNRIYVEYRKRLDKQSTLADKSLVALKFWFDHALRPKIPMESLGLDDIVWGLFVQIHQLLQYPNVCRNLIFHVLDTALDEICGDRTWDKPEKRDFWLKSALPTDDVSGSAALDDDALAALAMMVLVPGKFSMKKMPSSDGALKSAGMWTIETVASWFPGATVWGLKKLVVFLVNLIDKDFVGSTPHVVARIIKGGMNWLEDPEGFAATMQGIEEPKDRQAEALKPSNDQGCCAAASSSSA